MEASTFLLVVVVVQPFHSVVDVFFEVVLEDCSHGCHSEEDEVVGLAEVEEDCSHGCHSLEVVETETDLLVVVVLLLLLVVCSHGCHSLVVVVLTDGVDLVVVVVDDDDDLEVVVVLLDGTTSHGAMSATATVANKAKAAAEYFILTKL